MTIIETYDGDGNVNALVADVATGERVSPIRAIDEE
jgi:hypothetical protein